MCFIIITKKLNDAKKILKRYHKIRWLSRWKSITTLCDSLESVCVCFVMGKVMPLMLGCLKN